MSDSSPDIAGLTAEASKLYLDDSTTNIPHLILTVYSSTALLLRERLSSSMTILYIFYRGFRSMELEIYWGSSFLLLNSIRLHGHRGVVWCSAISFSAGALGTISQIGPYGILTLRTYAIYQKNHFVLCIVGSTGVATVVLGIQGRLLTAVCWETSVARSYPPSPLGNAPFNNITTKN
ncbi:hypothetical protein BD410DRAFT_808403 [Rickenella mellea]|uniref:Uncharacterized protein n=1 Tax=Rickenella mellea TaxID=50990 RepID=A0A4Y7PKU5_9AGAM|nr:hypothetical protein BD410DRAFT_808403 [Rickenella mellea]